jgi:hypothetical protein
MLSIPKTLEKIYFAARVYLSCSNVTCKPNVSTYEFTGSNLGHYIGHVARRVRRLGNMVGCVGKL